jgi:hypothetical protein
MLISSAVLLCCGLCAIHVFVPAAAVAYISVRDRVFPTTVVLAQAAANDALYVTPSTRPVLDGDFTNLTAWNLAAGRLRHDRLGRRSAGRLLINAMRKHACRRCLEKDNRATRGTARSPPALCQLPVS